MALVGAGRAVAEELDVVLRPGQRLRIVGAAIERGRHRLGDPGTPRGSHPRGGLVPSLERRLAAKRLRDFLALLGWWLAEAAAEQLHGLSRDLVVRIVKRGEQQLDGAFFDPQVKRLADLAHKHFAPLRRR